MREGVRALGAVSSVRNSTVAVGVRPRTTVQCSAGCGDLGVRVGDMTSENTGRDVSPSRSIAAEHARRATAPRFDGILGGMSRLERITSDPAICHGQPTIRGLRYPVENLLELLAAGMTIEEVLADYPDLKRDDLLAALEFGALAAGRHRVVPLGAA